MMPLLKFLSKEDFLFHLLSFLLIPDIIKIENLCLTTQRIFRNETIWKFIFAIHYSTLNPQLYLDEQCKRKLRRPHRQDCVGWQVNILQEHTADEEQEQVPVWRKGVITGFQINAHSHAEEYIVDYLDGETGVVEEERRQFVPWHLSGISRFDFLCPSSTSGASMSQGNDGNASQDDSMQRFSNLKSDVSWRDEVREMISCVPCRCLFSLETHVDEILDVEFSHNGRYLITVSRDGYIGVTEFGYANSTLSILRHRRLPTSKSLDACKISWSPDDSVVSIVLEDEPIGSPWGLVQTVVVEDIFANDDTSLSVGLYNIYPFDFYAHWLEDNVLVISERVEVLTNINDERMRQHIAFHDESVYGDESLISEFDLIGSLSNYGRGAELIRLPSLIDAEVSSTSTRTVMAIMSSENPFITNYIYFVDISEFDAMNATTVELSRCPRIDTKAAVLSIHANRSAAIHRYIVVNCRPLLDDSYLGFANRSIQDCFQMECPDVSESVECRVYDAVTLQHLSTFTGHHAFSLKNAIFFLYLDSLLFQSNDGSANNGSIEDTCDLIASGSEEHNIYIWHRRQERLVQVLRGHTNTVSTVTFNPVFPGVLASGADDFSCKIWVSETILPRNSAAIVMNQDI